MAYATTGGIQLKFGVPTVLKWADRDNDGAADASVMAAACAYADAEVDARLRDTHYRKPFVTAAVATPSMIADIANALAGCWLKDARGQDTFDEKDAPIDSLSWHRTKAYRDIADINSGQLVLDAI